MIVIGESGAMLKAGYLQRVQGYLAKRGVASILYDRIKPNPESGTVDEGAAVARDKKVDFIVGLGGGSAIDSAKSIAFMACNDGSIWDAIIKGFKTGEASPAPVLPIVALPTTAGSGTEANQLVFMTRSGCREKKGWRHDHLFPHLAIVDPELTHTLPSRITAYTGMSAFFHAVATLLAPSPQPASDMLALEAIQIISRFLPAAVNDGTDQQARTMLSWASTAAGMCSSLSAGSTHYALAHALSAYAPQLTYGAGLTLLSDAYFRWLVGRRPGRFDLLADAMGRTPESDSVDAIGRFLAALRCLIRSVGLDGESLANYELGRDDVPALARHVADARGDLGDMTPIFQDRSEVESILIETMHEGGAQHSTEQVDGLSAKHTTQRRSFHGS